MTPDATHADTLRRLNRLLGVGLDLEDWAAIERAIEKLEEPDPDWFAIERKVEQVINRHLDRFDTPQLAGDIVAVLP